MEVAGKKVCVTGGVRGLGRALVDRLVSDGALVTVFDVDRSGLQRLRDDQPEVGAVHCDLTDFSAVAAAVDRLHQESGSFHVLVNNAGILHSEPLIRIAAGAIQHHDVGAWSNVVAANLNSVFYMTACIAKQMVASRTRGVIVNVSSVSARGNAGQSAYSAAKAGVNALTVTWAKELSPMGIRVVAVAPGFTETESTREAVSEAVLQETVKRVPLRRLGKPAEIAEGILSLIRNDFFNGKVLELDGGLRI